MGDTMVNLFICILFSSFILISFNELLYLTNFTSFSFGTILGNFSYGINCIIVFVTLVLLYFCCFLIFKILNIKIKKNISYVLISVVEFILIYFVANELVKIDTSFQTALSLMLSVILSSFQFFYTISVEVVNTNEN